MKRSLTGILLVFVLAVVITPASLFVAPQKVHAQFGGIGGIVNDPINGIILAANKLVDVGISTILSSFADSISIKEYILDGISWAVSQRILQAVTGSVVNFVNGQGNGTGQPQFIQNLLGNLQGVGDTEAFSFLAQFTSNSNSPFAGAIVSSLRTNYLQQTSLSGFFASSQCTLNSVSPNINSFLAGNWSQGGAAAWFALTTQDQNNPYMLYQSASGQLGSLINQAQFARVEDYQNGQGFISWCDPNDSSTSSSDSPDESSVGNPDSATVPSQQCFDKDGNPTKVQTPGSVIHDNLAKALGSGVDKLVSADEIDEILGQLADGLLSSALGGASGGLGGLSRQDSSGRSYIDNYTAENPAANATNGGSGSAYAISSAQTAQTNAANYKTAWDTISAAANTASSSLKTLGSCAAQANAANTALLTEVLPVLNNAAAAQTSIDALNAMATKVQTEASAASSPTSGATGALSSDLQTLLAMPPSMADIANAQADAGTTGGATSTSANSLTVSGGTTVDRMNLIATNSNKLSASCGAPATH